jgi:hypothetical protein
MALLVTNFFDFIDRLGLSAESVSRHSAVFSSHNKSVKRTIISQIIDKLYN